MLQYNCGETMKNNEKEVIYYSDELNDDFIGANDEVVPYTKKYVYYKTNLFYKMKYFFWNKIFAIPVSIIHAKAKFGWKIINKKAFKSIKNSSYFIYGNHTQAFFDATMPKIISNKDCHIIVSETNVTKKGISFLAKRLGALPILNDYENTKNFVKAIDNIVKDNKPILIYPEAHIWPYYTKIRPFKSTSFRYPIKYNIPSFCFTNTYQKNGKKFRIVTYIDGPFYPNEKLSKKEQIEDLRNQIYNKMVERSLLNNYEKIIYKKKEI